MTVPVLARWYAAHPAVRRLWAVREPQRMRVIVTLVPTNDGDDTCPAWLANGGAWAHELQAGMEGPVHLEVVDEPAPAGGGDLVAELSWRDASASAGYPPDA